MSTYSVDFNKGIMNEGDISRLLATMKKALAGGKLTVGFLGGSITQGSLSSTPELCYAYRVYEWWTKKFPKAEFTYVNAGIGGTTSQFGVARVQDDLLQYAPDFTIIEFSVNDENTEHFKETYEGLVRKVYSDEHMPAMVLVHNIMYNNGYSAEDMHLQIGKAYNLPCVSMKSSVYPMVVDGTIKNAEITPDDLHPNDAGHELLAGLITNFLEKVYEKAIAGVEPGVISTELPKALTANEYQFSTRYQNHNSNPVMKGFEADPTVQNHITETFRKGFTAWKEGDSITFEVEGTGVAVQYRKSVPKPTPIAKVVVDGDEENGIFLDGNFDEDWGDCIYIDTVTKHTENKVHTVEVKIVEAHEDDVVPFYLVSVIGSK